MDRSRIVIVGGGFAGYHAAQALQKMAPKQVEIVLINPTDYFLYLPLMPEVAAGILEGRRIAVSLSRMLPRVRLVLGKVDALDLDQQQVGWIDPEGTHVEMGYDRLIMAAGSVNKLLPIPGVAEHAHGFRGIGEALYLRDHITRQVEIAATARTTRERDERCTFVVVGAGYTGTEVVAQGQLFTARLARRMPSLRNQHMRWMILDIAPRLLPELDRRLSDTAERVLRKRGVEVRTGQSIKEAMTNKVRLTTGEEIATRSLIWCVGVRPDPLVTALELETRNGRMVVDEYLCAPNHLNLFACGDCAAVPDVTRPGELTAMTAQHAERQGQLVAHNVLASLNPGATFQRYRHRDLGFLVDLGGGQAAANPLNIPLSGFAAKAITRGYHLYSLPGNRIRTASDWALNVFLPPPSIQFGLIGAIAVSLDTEEPLVDAATPGTGGSEMTTAVIGTGNIGSRVAGNLVRGGERVILAGRDHATAQSLAGGLGNLATSASIADAVTQADAVVLALWLDAEKDVISNLAPELEGKVVIDTSHPMGPDGRGGYSRTLPDGQSAGSIVANMLPAGAHYVKAFSSVGADALGAARDRKPDQVALFYATDDDIAAAAAERLIRASGFDPVRVGGLDEVVRIEAGGDLQQFGGLDGRLLTADEAMAAI